MKKKNLLLTAFMLVFAFYISAQSNNPLAVENQFPDDRRALNIFDDYTKTQLDHSATALRTTWIANSPRDNWFISLNGGAAILSSEETRYMDLKDQIKPTVGLAIGKWFSPVWGLRLSATGSKLQGFAIWNPGANPSDPRTGSGHGSWFIGTDYPVADVNLGNPTNTYVNAFGGPGTEAARALIYERFLEGGKYLQLSEGPGYTYDVTYVGASVDFLLNLKNMFTPYNHKAFFNPVLYAGVGYARTLKEKERTTVNSMMGKFGLQLNFRLSDRWDFFADAQALMLPEYFDRRVGDNMIQDYVFNATAGFTYRFNFRHFIKAPVFDTRELDALNREINELRNRELVCPPVVVCPPAQKVVEKEQVLLTPVFFTLDSYVVRDNQLISIAKAAQFLIANPGVRIQIAAYADRNTGNPAHNMRLSQNRANAVANVLADKFGIERRRLEITYFGDTVQPFEENDWNRVAIFIVP
jgi:hypothetical protein